MPKLKQLTCTVQWASSNIALPEYGTVYGDGVVETYLCVPSSNAQNFSIRLYSKGFIFEGLAIVVFVDGQYHVNRNRVNLVPPQVVPEERAGNTETIVSARRRTEVDFIVRQKEKSHGDGLYMGRSWRFDDHNLVDEDPGERRQEKYEHYEKHFGLLGCIEVVVLRCRARKLVHFDHDDQSSAADSDVMDHSRIATTSMASQPLSTPVEPQGTTEVAPAPAIEDDTLGGLFGLFDGAYGYCDRRQQHHWDGYSPKSPADRPRYVPQYAEERPPPQPPHRVHFDLPSRAVPPCSPQYSLRTAEPQNKFSRLPRERPPSFQEPFLRRTPSPEYVQCASHNGTGSRPDRHEVKSRQHIYEDKYSQSHIDHGRSHYCPDRDETMSSNTNLPRQSSTRHQNQSINPDFSDIGSQRQQPQMHPAYRYELNPHPFTNWGRSSRMAFEPGFHPYYTTTHTPVGSLAANFPMQSVLPASAAQNYPSPFTYHPQCFDRSHAPTSTLYGMLPWPFLPYANPAYMNAPPFGVVGPHFDMNMLPSKLSTGSTADQISQKTCPTKHEHDQTKAESNCTTPQGQESTTDDGWGDGEADNTKESQNWTEQDTNKPKESPDSSWDQQGNNNWGAENSGKTNASDEWKVDKTDTAGNRDCDARTNETPANDNWTGNATNTKQSSRPPPLRESSTVNQQMERQRTMYGPYGPWQATEDTSFENLAPDALEEPRYDVPRWYAEDISSTKQVIPGPGFIYYKKSRNPEYIDTLAEPYARFVFKYRTKDEIKKEIGINIELKPTSKKETMELHDLDKQALVDRVVIYEQKYGKLSDPELRQISSTSGQDAKQPVALAPPDRAFLDYELPEGRPQGHNSASTPSSDDAANGGNVSAERADNHYGPANDQNTGKQGWNDKAAVNQQNCHSSWDGPGWSPQKSQQCQNRPDTLPGDAKTQEIPVPPSPPPPPPPPPEGLSPLIKQNPGFDTDMPPPPQPVAVDAKESRNSGSWNGSARNQVFCRQDQHSDHGWDASACTATTKSTQW